MSLRRSGTHGTHQNSTCVPFSLPTTALLDPTYRESGARPRAPTVGQLLKAHVKVTGAASFVDYGAIKKDPGTLHRYTTILSAVTREEYESFSKAEKLALLINAYNAFTEKLVAENYHDKLRSIGIYGSETSGGGLSSPSSARN